MLNIVKQKRFMAIDPGVDLGWAFWPAGRKFPTDCGIIIPHVGLLELKNKFAYNKEITFFQKIHSTIHQLSLKIVELEPEIIACEWPQSFGSVGGRAASGSGSIIKLAYGVGQIALMADACRIKFAPIPVMQWKGNLSKINVMKRIIKRLPSSRIDYLEPGSHSWDAIGIGLFCKGLF